MAEPPPSDAAHLAQQWWHQSRDVRELLRRARAELGIATGASTSVMSALKFQPCEWSVAHTLGAQCLDRGRIEAKLPLTLVPASCPVRHSCRHVRHRDGENRRRLSGAKPFYGRYGQGPGP